MEYLVDFSYYKLGIRGIGYHPYILGISIILLFFSLFLIYRIIISRKFKISVKVILSILIIGLICLFNFTYHKITIHNILSNVDNQEKREIVIEQAKIIGTPVYKTLLYNACNNYENK